jgi:hypothetical protein
VSGLGDCDVWRLELSAVRWPWLLDEPEEARGPLEEVLQPAREEFVATACDEPWMKWLGSSSSATH